jgi:predicted molibdopterin-dependent oxidoreductase YjgC
MENNASAPRFVRLAETGRARVPFELDGRACYALEGDTLLVAMLANGAALRASEFGDGRRAGFCLMAACQDCWVWTAEGERLRACSTEVAAGMRIRTEGSWHPERAT